jgi:hypothetical protein
VNSFLIRPDVVDKRFRAFRRLAFGVINDFFFFRAIHHHLKFSFLGLGQFGSVRSDQP